MKRFLLGLTLILVLGLSIVAYLDYRIPRATATVQVHPLTISQSHMEDEFQAILAHETLSLAATLLEIEKPHQDKAIKNMKENVTLGPIRGTDLITITVKDPEPKSAIATANAIAEAYSQRREATEKIRAQRALEALDEELAAQQNLVDSYLVHLNSIPPNPEIVPNPNVHLTQLPLKQNSHDQAKEIYERSLTILREMRIAQEEARTLLKNPRPPITIHERATLTPTTR